MDDLTKQSIIAEMNVLYDMGENISRNALKDPSVKHLMDYEQFDLVLAETFVTEALYGLAQHFNAPIIGISSFSTISWVDALVGNTSPLSYLPHPFLPYTSKMTFAERFYNLGISIFEKFRYTTYHIPKQRAIYNTYFPNATLTFDEMLKNFSLILLNQHFSLTYPRPYVPNMIEVGGLHVQQEPDPLPLELQHFLDNATEGAIYFSLGSNLKGKKLPIEKRQIFLNTFASLKQKVLWKFEDDDGMPEKPDNVYISEWFPQPSILAHRNVKVFITHGGWLSTTESVFYAKPILGMPMFGDQPTNVAKAVRQGIALSIDFGKLNEVELKQKLHELLNNPHYNQTIRNLSRRYRDQPMTPLDTAVFWVEYVLRNGGAHLRNAGLDLSFVQYHSLDTTLTILAMLLLVAYGLVWIFLKLRSIVFDVNTQKFMKKMKIK